MQEIASTVMTSDCDVHVFPDLPLKQAIAFSREKLSRVLALKLCTLPAVTFVHSWARCMLGILSQLIIPVWLLWISRLTVCADSPVITRVGPKGGLLMLRDCRPTVRRLPDSEKSWDKEAAVTCGASLKGHFWRGVHPSASYVHSPPPLPPPPPQRLLIMCSLVLTQLWGAPKFTGRRGEGGGGERAIPVTEVRGMCFLSQPSPYSVSPSVFCSSW